MIQAMDSPEASVTSLWERLTGSPWWKTVLIVIILIVLYLLFAPCICNCITGFVSNHLKAFKLQMVVQAPTSATTSSKYYLGPLDQRPSIRALGEYVVSTIYRPRLSTAGSSYGMKTTPLSLGNIILLKEKGGVGGEWESQFLGRLIRSPEFPGRRKGSGALEAEIGVWNSQGEKDKHHFFLYIP